MRINRLPAAVPARALSGSPAYAFLLRLRQEMEREHERAFTQEQNAPMTIRQPKLRARVDFALD